MARDVFSVSRSAFDHPLLSGERFTRFQMWLWILSSASWKARRVRLAGRSLRLVDLERGAFLTTIRDLAEKSRWSKDTVRRFLDALIAEDMISAEPDTGGTLIRVRNYETYQLKPRGQMSGPDSGPDTSPVSGRVSGPVSDPVSGEMPDEGYDPYPDLGPEPDPEPDPEPYVEPGTCADGIGTDAGRFEGHPYIRNTENTADTENTGKTENAAASACHPQACATGQPAANILRLERAKKPPVPGKVSAAGQEAQRAFDAYCALVCALNAERGETDQLSCPQSLNGTRRAALKARLGDCGGFSGWQMALEEVRRSSYLLGRRNDYRVTLDSLLGRKLFTKLMEGGFRDGDTRHLPAFYDAIDRAI